MAPLRLCDLDVHLARHEQFMCEYAQCRRDPLEALQRDVAGPPLHVRDEGSVQAGLKRQRFLTPSSRSTQRYQIQRQYLPNIRALGGRWSSRTRGHREAVS